MKKINIVYHQKMSRSLADIPVSTQNWAIPFGAVLTVLASIQFGEAIYAFLDIQKSVDSDDIIYQMALKQLILTVITIFFGFVGLFLWKTEDVSRTVLKVLSLLCFALFGYSVYMVIMLQRLVEESPSVMNDDQRIFVKRSEKIKYANIVLMVLVFFFGMAMIWSAAFKE